MLQRHNSGISLSSFQTTFLLTKPGTTLSPIVKAPILAGEKRKSKSLSIRAYVETVHEDVIYNRQPNASLSLHDAIQFSVVTNVLKVAVNYRHPHSANPLQCVKSSTITMPLKNNISDLDMEFNFIGFLQSLFAIKRSTEYPSFFSPFSDVSKFENTAGP